MTKICSKCGIEKPLEDFNKDKGKADGYANICKLCRIEQRKLNKDKTAEYNKKYRETHAEYYKQHNIEHKDDKHQYYIEHKKEKAIYDKLYMAKPENKARKVAYDKEYVTRPEVKEMRKQYTIQNRDKICQKQKAYRLQNIDKLRQRDREQYQIKKLDPQFRINTSISTAINFSIRDKKERHWEDLVGYTIADLMKHLEAQFEPEMTWDNYGEWHIDHIIPKSSLEFSSYTDDNFKIIWGLANLRPLWAKDNWSRPRDGSDIPKYIIDQIVLTNLGKEELN